MGINGIISAIVVGLVIGALGRLVVPGKQAMGWVATILVGLVAAFIGAWIGNAINAGTIITLVIQVVLAAAGVAAVAGGTRGRNRSLTHH
ncbi:GlsB/YeaQ/YmgE family stress response membrane protein [Kineococcus glutinatus]|uniref:Membrane protein YeaQ/YmgE (Transglycosylase-associated protein family) n=1 Tax=Kineococcus glutinatus TaxID=1070872 RepID=A0ABP9HV94_9ACTN